MKRQSRVVELLAISVLGSIAVVSGMELQDRATPGLPALEHRDKVFALHAGTTAGRQDLVAVLRAITNLQQVSITDGDRAIHVVGVASEIGIAEWLLAWLDRAATPKPRSPVSHTDHSDVVRILYLDYHSGPEAGNEAVDAIRTMADVQRIQFYDNHSAIVLRGTPEQATLAEGLVQALDNPGNTVVTLAFNGVMVHVFYLGNASPGELKATVSRIRTSAQIEKVIACLTARAIIVRGTAAGVAGVERLIQGRGR